MVRFSALSSFGASLLVIALVSACASSPKPEAHAEGESATTAVMPSMSASDESTPALLQLARE